MKKRNKNKIKDNKVIKKLISIIKKYWFILLIILLSLLRFLFTYKLPNFYLYLMSYDDGLTVEQFYSLISGDYLGVYGVRTIIKGPVFPFLLFISKIYKMHFSTFFTLLYIFVCTYFIQSLKNIIKNKKYLIIIFVVLLFNPVTYSQDLFQRLYRNSISITELLFFLGATIRVLFNKEEMPSGFHLYSDSSYQNEITSLLNIYDGEHNNVTKTVYWKLDSGVANNLNLYYIVY